MEESFLIFQGDAQILLHGYNALVPLSLNERRFTSAIGFENSELIVNEHRERTMHLLENNGSGDVPDNFSEIFNHSAHVEIRYIPEKQNLNIDLFETLADINLPVLWMGVLENNLMPAYEVEWEIFKPIDENNLAFCALLTTPN